MHLLRARIIDAYTEFQDESEMDANGSVNEVYTNHSGISIMERCVNSIGEELEYIDFVAESTIIAGTENLDNIDQERFCYQGFEAVIKTRIRKSSRIHELGIYESKIVNFSSRVCRHYNEIWFCVFKIAHDDYSIDEHWLEFRMYFILPPANPN
jgi:hypothetical protein